MKRNYHSVGCLPGQLVYIAIEKHEGMKDEHTSQPSLEELSIRFCCRLRIGSHDPFFYPITSLSLFQLIEMLICITNFFEFE